jgi:hypothetical protein
MVICIGPDQAVRRAATNDDGAPSMTCFRMLGSGHCKWLCAVTGGIRSRVNMCADTLIYKTLTLTERALGASRPGRERSVRERQRRTV